MAGIGRGKGGDDMAGELDVALYLTGGVETIVKGLLKGAAFHPREAKFMAQFALSSKRAAALRGEAEKRGEPVPICLTAGVTREGMTGAEWLRVFREASEMGVGFIVLADGEPMACRDVLEAAGQVPEILFPVFANGTVMTDDLIDLFDRRRHLVPVVGVRDADAMARMKRRHMNFVAVATVTPENLSEITSEALLRDVGDRGCKAVLFMEALPTAGGPVLSDKERATFLSRLDGLRHREKLPLLVCFPGDERSFGGCLAAGRGFFHINADGGAEPCPYAPCSDVSVRERSLREALRSGLFRSLQGQGLLDQAHDGGCALRGWTDHDKEVS